MLQEQHLEGTLGQEEERTVVENYLYDIERYLNHSTTINQDRNKNQLEASIRAEYHMIEKGLSLKEPRLGFGRKHIDKLLLLMDEYVQKAGPKTDSVLSTAFSILQEYLHYHKVNDYDLDEYRVKIEKFKTFCSSSQGGVVHVSKKELIPYCQTGFKEFAMHRYSIRNYTDETVSID